MRVRTFPLLVLLPWLLAACAAGGDQPPSEPEAVPETIRYTALGDSLATGTGAETSYVDEYADWLREQTGSTVEVTNLAVDGWTSEDLLAALDADEEIRAAARRAHVVTWDIGGNDLLAVLPAYLTGNCGGDDGQACVREAVDTAARNGEAVLDELLELRDGEAAGLRTLNLYVPFVGDARVAPFLDELRPHLDRLNAGLTRSSRARGVPVADVHAAFHGPDGRRDPAAEGLLSDDGIHPSDRGHRVIAAELAALGLELGRSA